MFGDGATHSAIIRRNVIEDTGDGWQKIAFCIRNQASEVVLEDKSITAKGRFCDNRQ